MTTTRTNDSVLRTLRAVVPERRLTYFESLRIAELQANRLLELFSIRGPVVPSEIVTEIPRIQVRYDYDLPVSGSTHWENGHWVITIHGNEPVVRQRFSLMHEFKHVLDHTTTHWLYGDTSTDPAAADRAERVADHFAACLLMPKRWLKSSWVKTQSVPRLANRLGVSGRALSIRLWHLGLVSATQRCPRTSHPDEWTGNRGLYLRYTPLATEAA
jgi:Zn-dependent peptidase ImmA (M78 family)